MHFILNNFLGELGKSCEKSILYVQKGPEQSLRGFSMS